MLILYPILSSSSRSPQSQDFASSEFLREVLENSSFLSNFPQVRRAKLENNYKHIKSNIQKLTYLNYYPTIEAGYITSSLLGKKSRFYILRVFFFNLRYRGKLIFTALKHGYEIRS